MRASGDASMIRPARSRPVVLYLVTDDWYFLSHRLPMADAARRAGYDVHVATRVERCGPQIEARGFHLHPLAWRRGNRNPLAPLALVREVRRLYRRLMPDLLHHVALRPAVVGSLAAAGLGIPRLNALAGLGFAFASPTFSARVARLVLSALLRVLLNRPHSAVLVQNPDDRALMAAFGVAPGRLFLIPGSGVDTDLLQPLPEPEGPVTLGFVGRLLEDKGVRCLLEAHRLLRERGQPVGLLLAGEPDPGNPASVSPREAAAWRCRPGVTLLGHVEDIRDVWRAAHIAVLPSRREGMPKSLLEAAACGRPLVATDVPGCREVARPGTTGLLVPPDDPAALADAIERLAQDGDLRRRFGTAARRLVEETFSSRHVGAETVALYAQLIGQRGGEPRPLPA